jgi:hypothetical protein
LKATLQQFSSYNVKTAEELKASKPKAEDKVARIKHLTAYDGFCCLRPACTYCTRNKQKIKEHTAAHVKKEKLATA